MNENGKSLSNIKSWFSVFFGHGHTDFFNFSIAFVPWSVSLAEGGWGQIMYLCWLTFMHFLLHFSNGVFKVTTKFLWSEWGDREWLYILSFDGKICIQNLLWSNSIYVLSRFIYTSNIKFGSTFEVMQSNWNVLILVDLKLNGFNSTIIYMTSADRYLPFLWIYKYIFTSLFLFCFVR